MMREARLDAPEMVQGRLLTAWLATQPRARRFCGPESHPWVAAALSCLVSSSPTGAVRRATWAAASRKPGCAGRRSISCTRPSTTWHGRSQLFAVRKKSAALPHIHAMRSPRRSTPRHETRGQNTAQHIRRQHSPVRHELGTKQIPRRLTRSLARISARVQIQLYTHVMYERACARIVSKYMAALRVKQAFLYLST